MAVNLVSDLIRHFEDTAKDFIGIYRQKLIEEDHDNKGRRRKDIPRTSGNTALVGLSMLLNQVQHCMAEMWSGQLITDTAVRFGTYPFSGVFIGGSTNALPSPDIYESMRVLPGCPQPTQHTDIMLSISCDDVLSTIMVVRVHRQLGIVLEIFVPFDTVNSISKFQRSDFIGGIDGSEDKMNTIMFIGDFVLTLYFDDETLKFVKISSSALEDIESLSNIAATVSLLGTKPASNEVAGDPTNGYPTNGDPTNGYPTNGDPTNGYPTNGDPANADTIIINNIKFGIGVSDGVISNIFTSRLLNPALMLFTPKQFPPVNQYHDAKKYHWEMYGKRIDFEWDLHGTTQVLNKFTIAKLPVMDIVPATSQALTIVSPVVFAEISSRKWTYHKGENTIDDDSDEELEKEYS